MPDDDIDLGPDDREEALRRGFSQHDTLTFMGKPLRPMTAGTIDLLQKTGNRFLAGERETPYSDAAGFVLIHAADEEENRTVRSHIWRGRAAWNEYIFQFLHNTPAVEQALIDAKPAIIQVISDYAKSITKSVSAPVGKKKSGRRGG